MLSVIWGVNFSVIKAALAEFEPLAFNALRFPLAATTLFIMLRLKGPIPLPKREHWARVVILGLLANVVYQFFFIFGINLTLAGNASLMLATTPIWTLILATMIGHEHQTAAVWLGVGATLGGMVLVVVGSGNELGLREELLGGDLLLVAAAIIWAIYTVGSQDLTRHYGALAVTSWTLWVGTMGLVALGAGSVMRMDLASISVTTWLGVAYAGIFGIAVAYFIWNYGLEHIGAPRTAAFSNLVPVVALITATVWLAERPSPLQMLGAAIIIGGVWVARVARVKESTVNVSKSAL